MTDHSVLYQETSLNYFHYLALHQLKISNRTDRREQKCVRKTLNGMLDNVWEKQNTKKYSQNTSWFWQTAEAFTPSGLSEMTSHTPVMQTRPASAVWGIYRPLWALIHPHTHTHTHTHTHNWRWSQTSECTMSSNSHTERHCTATGFIHKWHLSDLN